MPRTNYESLVSVAADDNDYTLSGDSVALILALLSPFYLSSAPENEDAAQELVAKAIREVMTPARRIRAVGEIYATISPFTEPGHLTLDGQVLLREEYEELWQVVPAHWRVTLTSPDGESIQTILLPDQTGNMYLSGGSVLAVGVQFGQNTYSLSQSQLPPHNHRTLGIDTVTGQPQAFVIDYMLTTNRRVWNSGYTENTGAGAAIDNRPLSLGVRWVIVATNAV